MNQNAIKEVAILVTDSNDSPLTFDIIADHQSKCRDLQKFKNTQKLRVDSNQRTLYFVNKKIYLPSSFLNRVIMWYHDALIHPGIVRNHKTNSAQFYHPKLLSMVQTLLQSCPQCLMKEPFPKHDKLPPAIYSTMPWESI